MQDTQSQGTSASLRPHDVGGTRKRSLDHRRPGDYDAGKGQEHHDPEDFMLNPRAPEGGVREGDNWHSDEAVLNTRREKKGSVRRVGDGLRDLCRRSRRSQRRQYED